MATHIFVVTVKTSARTTVARDKQAWQVIADEIQSNLEWLDEVSDLRIPTISLSIQSVTVERPKP